MERVGFAVIGCGSIANSFHLPELVRIESARLVAVVDLKPNRAKITAERFKVPYWYTDYHKVLELEDVEAVIVATPHPSHAAIAVEAIEAGKHVMIQKPMATSVEEADRIVKATRRHGEVKVMVLPFIYFDTPLFDHVKGLMDRGELGKVCMARARVAHGGPEVYQRTVAKGFGEKPERCWFLSRKGARGGVLLDLGVYPVAMIMTLFGGVRGVSAFTATLMKEADVEDNAVLILQMDDGILAIAEASWTQAAPLSELSIYGSEGVVLLNTLTNGLRFYRKGYADWATFNLPREKEPQHTHRHFVRCILEDRKPIGTVEDGRRLVQILETAYRSAESGKNIALHHLS